MNKLIAVTRSSMPLFEEYCDEIKVLWENRWLSNRGCIHKEFEKDLQERMKVDYVTLYANGHVALEVAIDAFRFPKGGEVITTPYTHCSTTHAIVRNGLIPVFCDVNDEDYTIDVNQIEKYITSKTVAIVATHVYGLLCDVDAIDNIAKNHNLKVIYDAAHAFGVKRNGVDAAAFGDASMFSCHATKVFHTIEGGIVVYKDKAIYDNIESLVNFGFMGPEEVQFISTNARMNEFEAAMGICNLRHIDDEIVRRKTAADRYVELLSGVAGIRLVSPQPGITPNYSYFPVFFDGYKCDRNEVQAKLKEFNILARKYFYPIVPDMLCYKDQFVGKEFPVSKHAADTVLALPMFADLTVDDVERICRIILD
jgi:dTDP-4-amino-4,6-dideoxygalactose transaminase